MDKQKVLDTLISQLQSDFEKLKAAALATYEDATHEETKPENQYDTRALEASYLAGAQAERVAETAEVIGFCKALRIRPQEKVGIGALVEIEQNGKSQIFFFLPKGGGINIKVDGKLIQVMTPTSPLGKILVGLGEGDNAELGSGGSFKEYDVVSVK